MREAGAFIFALLACGDLALVAYLHRAMRLAEANRRIACALQVVVRTEGPAEALVPQPFSSASDQPE